MDDDAMPPLPEPYAHTVTLLTKDAGPTRFFTSPSDPRARPAFDDDQVHAYARAYAEQETARLRQEPLLSASAIRHMLNNYANENQRLFDRAEAAEQETASLRADAERYRWLKMFSGPFEQARLMSSLPNIPWGQWDATIDAARKKEDDQTN